MSKTAFHDLRMQGAGNFRDIGDRVTIDGQRIRAARVFRSGELSRLTDADYQRLRQIGIAFVADLRSQKECAALPTHWPADMAAEVYTADIGMDSRVDGRPVMDVIFENPTPEHATNTVARAFSSIADMCGPALRVITAKLAEGVQPVIFHCTNGRDRTGIVAAMMLYMLGASRDEIVHDFMLTNERIDFRIAVENSINAFRKAMGVDIDREIVEMITLVRPHYIDTLFKSFDERYGSPEGYLDHFGIDAAMREALRGQLLEVS